MLGSLDLFAGVGGIAHAMRGFASPAMYCEIDPHAQAVLRKLMAQGKLPKAPIHPDVTTLDGKTLRGRVDLIAGGFPCTGMSNSGKREGFANEQSGLYAHVVRLINEIQPPFVFLENVAPIVELGMDDVLATLGKAGYNAAWVTVYAYHVGAPQLRKRWFCLASRPSALGKTIKSTVKFTPFKWGREPSGVPRMTKESVPYRRNRLGMLGNSVVPDLVRMAFCWLFSGGTMDARAAPLATSLTLRLPEALKPFAPGAKRVYGVFKGGKLYAIAPPKGLLPRPDLKLVLDPAAVPPPEKTNPLQTTDLITRPISIQTWATPRRGVTHGARVLTKRCKQDLPTQLRFERGTPVSLRMGYVSPRWTEWLMGFENDWTLVPADADLPKSVADPDELSQCKKNKSSACVKAPSSSVRTTASVSGRRTGAPAAPIAKRALASSTSSRGGTSAGAKTKLSKTR
jgi:DNA (cytosine-5)-methyltransferase 1